jgi:excisionase family DNA binding protein
VSPGVAPATAPDLPAADHSRPDPLLIRVEEAARLLSVARSTVYELVERGEFPSVKVGRNRRIRYADLAEWAAGLSDGAGR